MYIGFVVISTIFLVDLRACAGVCLKVDARETVHDCSEYESFVYHFILIVPTVNTIKHAESDTCTRFTYTKIVYSSAEITRITHLPV